MLSQVGPRTAAVNFDTYQSLNDLMM